MKNKNRYPKIALIFFVITSFVAGICAWVEYPECVFIANAYRTAKIMARPNYTVPTSFDENLSEAEDAEYQRVLKSGTPEEKAEQKIEMLYKFGDPEEVKDWNNDPINRPPWHSFHSMAAISALCLVIASVLSIWLYFKPKKARLSPLKTDQPSDPLFQ